MNSIVFFALAAVLAIAAAMDCPDYNDLRIMRGTANNARGLTGRVNRFRDLLGEPNNGNELCSLATGIRQINWDAPIVPFDMPGDFFNTQVPRGIVLTTPGGEFRVSNSRSPPDNLFDSIVPISLSRQFTTFSSPRLFSPLIRNQLTAEFRVSGTSRRAAVTGFGAIFVDVDAQQTTYMDFRDCNGCLISRVFVPARDRGLSFAGLAVENSRGLNPAICSVDFRLGDISMKGFADRYMGTPVGDVVVLDDFIYGEPQRV